MTRSYVILPVTLETYAEIRTRMVDAGYGHAVGRGGEVDMEGIAIAPTAAPKNPDLSEEDETIP